MKKMLSILILLMMPLALQADDVFKDTALPGGLEITYSFKENYPAWRRGQKDKATYIGEMTIEDNVGNKDTVICKMIVFDLVHTVVSENTGIGTAVVKTQEEYKFKLDGIDYTIIHIVGGDNANLIAKSKAIGRSIRKKIDKINR